MARSSPQGMTTRANERASQLLAEHGVPPLPEAAEEVIVEVLKRREAEEH